LSAEQVTTTERPVASRWSIHPPMVRSHGQRSSSSSGWPAAIFSTLARGWKSSPSANSQSSRSARRSATVVFPEPDTPMTTTVVGGNEPSAFMQRP
jgi:hypothetical protein